MAVAATLVAIAFVVIAVAGAGALWRDEANSVYTATAGTWHDVWHHLEFESFPLLWIALVRGWVAIAGSSDISLRIVGGAGAIALIVAIWLTLRWCRPGRALPLVGLALVATNPEIIRWSTSVRAWGLGAALVIVAVALIYKATVVPARRVIATAAIAAVLAAQCVYQNAIVIAAAALVAAVPCLWRRDVRRALVPLGIAAGAIVSLLPYAGVMARRAGWNALGERPTAPRELAGRLWEVVAASGGPIAWIWVGLVVLTVAIAWRSAAASGVRRYAAATVLLAGAGITIFYLALRYPTQNWYYISLAALMAVGIDVVLAADERARILRQVRLTATVVILAAGIVLGRTSLSSPVTNIDRIAAELTSRAQPGDLIVLSPWYLGVSFWRYYRGPADVMTLPPLADAHVHHYDLLKVAMQDGHAIDPLIARLKAALSGGHCVWIVGALSVAPPRPSMPIPPPPLPDTGWNSGPYERAWILGVGELLAKHAASADAIAVPRGGPLENPMLVVIRGWR